jgi:hypothetical protein
MAIDLREPGAAQAGGYTLGVAGVLVALGLAFHPLPKGGFEEQATVLSTTPLWGPIHVAIAMGFVLCILGSLLMLVSGGTLIRHWLGAFAWAAIAVGMIFFTGVALINGFVMHALAPLASAGDTVVYDAFNRLLVGFGWLGNPLFLAGLTALAFLEVRRHTIGMSRELALFGLVMALLSWLRGVGSATGLYFLEPFLLANIPAFLWLGWYGVSVARLARR